MSTGPLEAQDPAAVARDLVDELTSLTGSLFRLFAPPGAAPAAPTTRPEHGVPAEPVALDAVPVGPMPVDGIPLPDPPAAVPMPEAPAAVPVPAGAPAGPPVTVLLPDPPAALPETGVTVPDVAAGLHRADRARAQLLLEEIAFLDE